ncbi:MAG TPA: rhodanese-like domain-containing protein [Pyrinomonadaceae bacterium]|nr:rhodanese-like domain-containing protein [Pyrinomonadaceae bacterium]
MRKHVLFAAILLAAFAIAVNAQQASGLYNPSIDMDGFLKVSQDAAKHRSTRRLTEEQFIAASKEPGVVILDARSSEKFNELHIAGAINLSFPDITVESLAKDLPDKATKILIYCNNNFENEPSAFPTKVAPASLNLSTYISLYTYGYRNVYELGPLLNAKTTRLKLISSKDEAKRVGVR